MDDADTVGIFVNMTMPLEVPLWRNPMDGLDVKGAEDFDPSLLGPALQIRPTPTTIDEVQNTFRDLPIFLFFGQHVVRIGHGTPIRPAEVNA